MVFRRDLRLRDNAALKAALETSAEVCACFILDPRQTSSHPYFSSFGAQFLRESLEDLAGQMRAAGGTLHVLSGEAEQVIATLLKTERIDAVFINRDYTPFSRKRDAALAETCKEGGAVLRVFGDALLHEPEDVHKESGKPYTVFTPFYNKASSLPLRAAAEVPSGAFGTLRTPRADIAVLPEPLAGLVPHGGRANALKILHGLEQQRSYASRRDLPADDDGTTKLSAHLKFGTCSVREAHEAIAARLGDGHPLLRQLYWRDFLTHVAYHFPHVFGGAFHPQYDTLKWSADAGVFARWCRGETGFPIVDAGMRQLRATGFMHNRVRMITASFLVKDLHQDWRAGERYFATKLTDYDPCVNNGNWQWAASTGCDAVPYFRIFNPWLQQEKFDPDCAYIRRWVPELRDVEPTDIHRWHKVHASFGSCSYPAPMVDHSTEAALTKSLYKATKS